MTEKVKVRAIGNSLGIVLSKELLTKLRAQKDDTLHVIETPGGVELRIYDPEFEKQMNVARKVAKRYQNALRELAK
jgi:putative addiction module antidote